MPQPFPSAIGGLTRGLQTGVGIASQFQQMGLLRDQREQEAKKFELEKKQLLQKEKQRQLNNDITLMQTSMKLMSDENLPDATKIEAWGAYRQRWNKYSPDSPLPEMTEWPAYGTKYAKKAHKIMTNKDFDLKTKQTQLNRLQSEALAEGKEFDIKAYNVQIEKEKGQKQKQPYVPGKLVDIYTEEGKTEQRPFLGKDEAGMPLFGEAVGAKQTFAPSKGIDMQNKQQQQYFKTYSSLADDARAVATKSVGASPMITINSETGETINNFSSMTEDIAKKWRKAFKEELKTKVSKAIKIDILPKEYLDFIGEAPQEGSQFKQTFAPRRQREGVSPPTVSDFSDETLKTSDEITARFRKDSAMQNFTIGNETPQGREVYDAQKNLVGYYK